jgi:uncharacterized alkaline shock family protein YloU
MAYSEIPGRVTVEPHVIEAVARRAALQVPGVVALAETVVDRFLKTGKAVEVILQEGRVTVNLRIIAQAGLSLRQLGKTVQHEVVRTIEEMMGLHADRVNVLIEDVMTEEMLAADTKAA